MVKLSHILSHFTSAFAFTFALSLSFTFAFSSCQLIPEAEQYTPIGPTELRSRALIVEFTGIQCVNCPKAAQTAHQLLEQYPENLVVVEMHPASNSFTATTNPLYDFRCEEADFFYRYFGGTNTTGLPTGIVNLAPSFADYTAWASAVLGAVQQPSSAQLHLSVMGDSIQYRILGTSGSYHLLLWLVEDSIVAPQADGGTVVPNYVHNHVLRMSLTPDEWGIILSPTDGTIAFTIPTHTSAGQPIRPEHCSVVGIILDENKRFIDVVLCRLTKNAT